VTLVRFLRADGSLDKEVEAEPGQRLLDVAWAARERLEGACEGVGLLDVPCHRRCRGLRETSPGQRGGGRSA
jgi:hypothetical protein